MPTRRPSYPTPRSGALPTSAAAAAKMPGCGDGGTAAGGDRLMAGDVRGTWPRGRRQDVDGDKLLPLGVARAGAAIDRRACSAN